MKNNSNVTLTINNTMAEIYYWVIDRKYEEGGRGGDGT